MRKALLRLSAPQPQWHILLAQARDLDLDLDLATNISIGISTTSQLKSWKSSHLINQSWSDWQRSGPLWPNLNERWKQRALHYTTRQDWTTLAETAHLLFVQVPITHHKNEKMVVISSSIIIIKRKRKNKSKKEEEVLRLMFSDTAAKIKISINERKNQEDNVICSSCSCKHYYAVGLLLTISPSISLCCVWTTNAQGDFHSHPPRSDKIASPYKFIPSLILFTSPPIS